MMQRQDFGKQSAGLSHGAVTAKDWGALCRTIFDVHAVFGEMPRPGLFVEIGTLGGRTTRGIFECLNSLKWDVPDVLTIDTDKSCLGNSLHGLCSGFDNSLRTFCGYSIDWQPLEPIWWAFIDGCHCEECVSADLKHISPYVPKGGIICLHDAGLQRDRGMLVHERYHDHDGVERLYGVTAAIDSWKNENWELVEQVPAQERSKGAPTSLFGGLQAFRRK